MHILTTVASEFEWDPKKAATNRRKHRVSFEGAQTTFYDLRGALIRDEAHSTDEEERFVFMGRSDRGRVLVTVFTERGDRRRLISSRRANGREVEDYEA